MVEVPEQIGPHNPPVPHASPVPQSPALEHPFNSPQPRVDVEEEQPGAAVNVPLIPEGAVEFVHEGSQTPVTGLHISVVAQVPTEPGFKQGVLQVPVFEAVPGNM